MSLIIAAFLYNSKQIIINIILLDKITGKILIYQYIL